MNSHFAYASLSLNTLLITGAVCALAMIIWSYRHWRAAVKIAFIAVIFEGAIRKWVFPQGQELVYFLKDVFLFGAYLKFYLAPGPDIRAFKLRVPGFLITILVIIVSLCALNPNIGSPILALYGIKIYFMYLPMAFMMPYLFRTEAELVRQATWYALVAIPVCLLGILQWRSDLFSVINTFASGMAETGAISFGFGEHARVTGTFSYLTGHTTFVIFFATLHIVLLSLKETPRKWLLLGISMPLLVGNALMGGARASVLTIAFVTIGFMIGTLTGRIGSARNFLGILVGVVLVAVGGVAYFFFDAWQHWEARYHVAGDTMEERVWTYPLKAMELAIDEGGFIGYGIGTAHPATESIRHRLRLSSTEKVVPVYDSEIGQIMIELGVIGFAAWYLLRFILFWLAWQSYRRSPPGAVRALSLAGVLMAGPFLVMSVVFNHTANFLIFGLAGFSLIPLLEKVNPSGARRLANQPGVRTQVRRRLVEGEQTGDRTGS